jgi:hypothetical protein
MTEIILMFTTYAQITPVNGYKDLKKSLKRTTAGYGSMISASYFITQGADQGVSASLGAVTSYVYLSLLANRVDKFEMTALQSEFLAPIGAAAFEVSWNNAPFAFDFDYGASFIGFLAYKFALSTVLYEIVREMMISDGETMYDTSEKHYNDLSDWSEQHGEVKNDLKR